jgi:hypothetical protein
MPFSRQTAGGLPAPEPTSEVSKASGVFAVGWRTLSIAGAEPARGATVKHVRHCGHLTRRPL